jgi:hypothetical protein
MRAGTAVAAVLLLLAMSPASAAADGPIVQSWAPAVAPSSASSVDPAWYGWQTLIADTADIGLVLVALKTSDSSSTGAAVALGAVGFIMPAPLIHFAHGQGVRAAISVGLRLGLPLLLGGAGMITGEGSCGGSSPPASGSVDLSGLQCIGEAVQGGVIGAAVGMGFAVLIDASALAWAPRDRAAAAAPGPALQWMPTAGVAYDLGHRGAPTVGIGVAF